MEGRTHWNASREIKNAHWSHGLSGVWRVKGVAKGSDFTFDGLDEIESKANVTDGPYMTSKGAFSYQSLWTHTRSVGSQTTTVPAEPIRLHSAYLPPNDELDTLYTGYSIRLESLGTMQTTRYDYTKLWMGNNAIVAQGQDCLNKYRRQKTTRRDETSFTDGTEINMSTTLADIPHGCKLVQTYYGSYVKPADDPPPPSREFTNPFDDPNIGFTWRYPEDEMTVRGPWSGGQYLAPPST